MAYSLVLYYFSRLEREFFALFKTAKYLLLCSYFEEKKLLHGTFNERLIATAPIAGEY